MTKTIVICEQCKAETESMEKAGWLQLEQIRLWSAKLKNPTKRIIFDCGEDTNNAKHFCSIKCTLAWLKKELSK